MRVRLKDIAADLGLSVVTISKVLRGHTDIGPETRARVLKRIKELNYRPNLTARALITGRSYTVGLVVPDLLHPFFAQVAKAVSSRLRPRGYGLLISSSEEDPELEREEIDRLLQRGVDALLVASSETDESALAQVREQKTPCVLVDREFESRSMPFVGVDDERVGELATSHLIGQKCLRIAHIRGPGVSTAVGRYKGYRRALGTRPEMVIAAGGSGDDRGDQAGYEATLKLLASETPPDGIFCYNDPVALGAMRAILDAGLRVPGDIAVVGCGNVHYSDFLRVPLTTVDQRSRDMGERAADVALELIEGKAPERPRHILVEPELVVRASSARRVSLGSD